MSELDLPVPVDITPEQYDKFLENKELENQPEGESLGVDFSNLSAEEIAEKVDEIILSGDYDLFSRYLIETAVERVRKKRQEKSSKV